MLGLHSKIGYVINRVFLVSSVDFSMAGDFQDCIYKVYCLFFLYRFDCQYKGGVVFAEVYEEVLLESHLDSFF